MNGKGSRSELARRLFLTRLGAGVGVVGAAAVSAPTSHAQSAEATVWKPTRHAQDDWMEKLPGQHRFVLATWDARGRLTHRSIFSVRIGARGLNGIVDAEPSASLFAKAEVLFWSRDWTRKAARCPRSVLVSSRSFFFSHRLFRRRPSRRWMTFSSGSVAARTAPPV